MDVKEAQYVKIDGKIDSIRVILNGIVCNVPLDPNNTDYAEILRQVKEGTLTIKDADE